MKRIRVSTSVTSFKDWSLPFRGSAHAEKYVKTLDF
jgi:hypothetical protein